MNPGHSVSRHVDNIPAELFRIDLDTATLICNPPGHEFPEKSPELLELVEKARYTEHSAKEGKWSS